MKLFCLPYAGGSSIIYYPWRKYADKSIFIEPIELKSRGIRKSEEFYKNFDEAVCDIFEKVKDKIDGGYAIYGHSMGAILAYELYCKICKENLPKPSHMFFSGCKPPKDIENRIKICDMSDEDILKNVISFGGISDELIKDKRMLKLFLPIIKNDFKILESYKSNGIRQKIDCDISVLNGKEDNISLEEISKWNEYGNKSFNVYQFQGGHFFIKNNTKDIVEIINKTLLKGEDSL